MVVAEIQQQSQSTEEMGKKDKMWIEKYRPEDFKEIISNQNCINTLDHLLEMKRVPHLLFYGPPGTGKTTTALVTSKKLNGSNAKTLTLELNASDDRGIETVRKEIKNFAETKQIFSQGIKFIILDEADAMTSAAQFALRRIIEKSTSNVRFCFICNYINKIIPAIQSRCTKFRFSLLEQDDIKGRLAFIAKSEKVEYDEDGLNTLIKLSDGDMRNCINMLQACFYGYNMVNEQNVYLCTGLPSERLTKNILNNLLNENFDYCFKSILRFQAKNGVSLSQLTKLLFELVLRVKFPNRVLMFLVDNFAELEDRLSKGCNERLQLTFLVAIFIRAREIMGEDNRKDENNMN